MLKVDVTEINIITTITEVTTNDDDQSPGPKIPRQTDTPVIVCFIEGGVFQGAMSNMPIDVIVYDRDNIDAGDEPPCDEDDLRQWMQVAY